MVLIWKQKSGKPCDKKHPLHHEIVKTYNTGGFSYGEIAEKYDVTRSIVAGIIWRLKNPGMYKKNVRYTERT